jgi:hypothetical protein
MQRARLLTEGRASSLTPKQVYETLLGIEVSAACLDALEITKDGEVRAVIKTDRHGRLRVEFAAPLAASNSPTCGRLNSSRQDARIVDQ